MDYIYDGLLSSNRLSKEVSDATEKAFYWKKVLCVSIRMLKGFHIETSP